MLEPEAEATMETSGEEGNGVEVEAGVEVDAEAVDAEAAPAGTGSLDVWDQQEEEKWAAMEAEFAALDPATSPVIYEYLAKQIDNHKNVKANPEYIRSDVGKIKLVQKMFVNVDEAPEDNWVGRILGFKGKNAKQIAAVANVKLAIQGKGSSKLEDPAEEEKLLHDGAAEHEHLKEPLHVRIESWAQPTRAWRNMQCAMDMLLPLMSSVPSPQSEAIAAAAVASAAQHKITSPFLYPDTLSGYDYFDDYYSGYSAKPVLRGGPGARIPRPHHPYAMMPSPYAVAAAARGKIHDPSRGRARGRAGARGRTRPY